MRKHRLGTVLTTVATVAFAAGCAPQKSKRPTEPSVAPPAGVVEVDTFRLSATVGAVDSVKRQITLVGQDGGRATYTAARDLVNFAEIRAGDRVNATIVEQIALEIGPAGAPANVGTAGIVLLTPRGAAPISANTVQISGRVTAIDTTTRRINLRFVDGSTRTYKVGTAVNIDAVRLGDTVTAVVSEGLAILVQRP